MENFDQLDSLVANNQTLIKQVIVFIVTVSFVLVICILVYAHLMGTKTLQGTTDIKTRVKERLNDLRTLQAIEANKKKI